LSNLGDEIDTLEFQVEFGRDLGKIFSRKEMSIFVRGVSNRSNINVCSRAGDIFENIDVFDGSVLKKLGSMLSHGFQSQKHPKHLQAANEPFP